MQRRRLPRRRALAAAAAAVAVAAAGTAVIVAARPADDGDRSPMAGAASTTTAPPATTTTTTTQPPTTTAPPAAPGSRLGFGPGSPPPPVPLPGEPVAASDAPGLAQQIAAAAAAIADPATPPAELARQAHVQQVAYRALVAKRSLLPAVQAALPEHLRVAAADNVEAGAKLRSLVKPRSTMPHWRIVDPAPASELLGYYREAETATGVPWQYLAAVHLVETRMGRIRGTSEAGAQGPMQFLPSTWAAYGAGGDINSNRDAIAAAARYLRRNGAPGDMRNALWNYNHSYRYVDAVTLYAKHLQADERNFLAYHAWQVYYVTVAGDVWLPVGYGT